MYTPHQLELLARLTSRERDVLWALMSQPQRKHMARKLGVSVSTLDNTQARIGEKWGLHTACRWALLQHFNQPQREVA